MNDRAVRPTTGGSARIAGLMFLLSLLVPALGWLLVFDRVIVRGDVVSTGRRVAAQGALFRAGIAAEVLTALAVLGLGWALYELLEGVDRRLATLGLGLKLVEASCWAVIAMAHVAAFRVLDAEVSAGALEPGRLHALVGLLLAVHMPVTAVPGIFVSLGALVFLPLLFRTRWVPRALAAFGIVSYALVLLFDGAMILAPGCTASVTAQAVGWGPSVLFELAIGAWLLARGVAPAGSGHRQWVGPAA